MGSFMRGLRNLSCVATFFAWLASFVLIDTYGFVAYFAVSIALILLNAGFYNFVEEFWPAPPTPQSTVSSNDYSDGGGPDGWGGPGDM